MTSRALWSIAFVVALVGGAAAEPKTKIGVLGLEVVGTIDMQGTTTARNLTDVMRAQAKASPRYTLSPTAAKDLIDEKVASSCDSEAQECMTKIAKKLGAQVLIFGKIEYKPKDGAEGYYLHLKLLDTDKKTVKTEQLWISLREVSDGSKGLDPRATEAFNKITESTPAVTKEPDVVIKDPPVKPAKKPGGGWRITAYATGAAALVATGAHVYAWTQLRSIDGGDKCIIVEGTDPADNVLDKDATGANFDKCKNGPRNRTITRIAGPTAIGFGLVALFASYKGFIATSKESSTPTGAGRSTRKRSRFAVTPIVSPDGAGATMRIDW